MSNDFQQRGGSPWGSPPGGGGGGGNGSGRGPTPPDIDKIIRELQDKIKNFLPGGNFFWRKVHNFRFDNFSIYLVSKWSL